MVVERQSDYQVAQPELATPPGEPMDQPLDTGMPIDGYEEAPPADTGFAGETDSLDDAPLDPDQLRAQLEQEFESRFGEDKKKLQSSYQEQINRAEADLFAATEASYVSNQQLQKAYSWVQDFIQKNDLDPRDAATFALQVMGAEKSARQQVGQSRQALEGWLHRQNATHHQVVQQRSVDPETGQQLFDPTDAVIQDKFNAFVEAGRRHLSRGGTPQTFDGASQKAWNDYQMEIESRTRAGLRGGTAAQRPAPGQAPTTPAENRARGVQRGAQNRLSGGSAAVTNETIMADAKQQYPGESREARLAQQAYWVQQRRKHNIEG